MLNFPATPAPYQVFTNGDTSWYWDSVKWVAMFGDPLVMEVPVSEIHGGTGVVNLDDAPVLAVGSTTLRTLGVRAADQVNVKDFGAQMNGTTSDTAAFTAAIAAVPARGIISVPSGGINVPSLTAATATKPILWRMSGNNFGTGSTPVTGIGNGLVETFLVNTTKFFGRGSTALSDGTQVPSIGPVLRTDMTVNHTGGVSGGLTAAQINVFVAPAYTGAMAPIGLGISVTDQRTAGTGSELVGFIATAARQHVGPSIFGGNAIADDRSGLNSSESGSAVGLEVNVKANKLDDGTTGDGHNINLAASGPKGGANRILLDLKYTRSNLGDTTPFELGHVLHMGPSSSAEVGDQLVKNFIAAVGICTFAGLNFRHVEFRNGANAIALKNENKISWTKLSDATTPNLTTDWSYLQYTTTGTGRLRWVVGTTELWSISDAGRMSLGVLPTSAASDAAASAAGVPVGGIYRNGSALQIRVA